MQISAAQVEQPVVQVGSSMFAASSKTRECAPALQRLSSSNLRQFVVYSQRVTSCSLSDVSGQSEPGCCKHTQSLSDPGPDPGGLSHARRPLFPEVCRAERLQREQSVRRKRLKNSHNDTETQNQHGLTWSFVLQRPGDSGGGQEAFAVSRTKDYCVLGVDLRKAATSGVLRSHQDNNTPPEQPRGEQKGAECEERSESESRPHVRSLCCPEGARSTLSSHQDKDRKTLRLDTTLGEFCLSPTSVTHLDVGGSVITKSCSVTQVPKYHERHGGIQFAPPRDLKGRSRRYF
ncbi:uncharacterized protein LOC122877897 [Siniperca chuatsi]|uniref:uncharacterized protein LOC122877897 n=1 Tax=Siniperca chuatsi TaxID=119488 RepID=UPI001CE19C02|nr:uncharacterized protein LOC122877897 [Siniperca chuatsi]